MATKFNEGNTTEQMIISTLKDNGWKYIPAGELPRVNSDVLVESMVKEALIRLNPAIAEEPSRADEVICKLRTLIFSVQSHNLITKNEELKKKILEENSYPFGEDGRMIPVRFFGTMSKEDLALNEYVVTNQWVYPKIEGGKRLDIVLLVNGFPIAIGELKTPVRSAITWLDAAEDISAYQKAGVQQVHGADDAVQPVLAALQMAVVGRGHAALEHQDLVHKQRGRQRGQ